MYKRTVDSAASVTGLVLFLLRFRFFGTVWGYTISWVTLFLGTVWVTLLLGTVWVTLFLGTVWVTLFLFHNLSYILTGQGEYS